MRSLRETEGEYRQLRRQREMETLRRLHGRARLTHIWNYYRLHIGAALAAALLLFSLLLAMLGGAKPARLYFSLYSSDPKDQRPWAESLFAQLSEAEGEFAWDQGSYFCDNALLSIYDQGYLSTRLGARELDVLIGTELLLSHMQEIDALASLRHILPEETLDAHAQQLIYANGIPVAFALTPAQYAWSAHEPHYLVVAANSKNPDDAAALIGAILQTNVF